ncbi:MAG: enoyl-CoA hydratase [Magnetovibrio sp.]|nr:enoyl-CoA hydratase [Magnetovibrio sp.]
MTAKSLEEQYVLREDRDGVAWLELNRPKKLNALSDAMIAAMSSTLDDIADDTSVRVVVISGAGGKAFSAGHDLKEMMSKPDQEPCEVLFGACAEMMLKIHHLPQPVIACVDGIATAAGCQLVAQCDLAIASDHSRFATSGINLGLFCATPSVPVSRAIGRKAAAELLYTGKFLSADDAEKLGLINRAVGAEVLQAEVENLALEIASKSPASVTFGKRLLLNQVELPLEQAYALAAKTMACNMQEDGTRAGIQAFIDKQPMPKWKDRS